MIDTDDILSAFMDVIRQRRRIFLLRCSLKVYTVILFLWSLNVRCCYNAEFILQLDPPTNAAIGPSPAQRRAAATSKNPTTWHTTPSTLSTECETVNAVAIIYQHQVNFFTYKYQLSLTDPSCRQSLKISAINYSGRASELGGIVNLVH